MDDDQGRKLQVRSRLFSFPVQLYGVLGPMLLLLRPTRDACVEEMMRWAFGG